MPHSSLALEICALLGTFALHSTLLLGGAWLLTRALAMPRLRELVWKGALVGALLTTAVQSQLEAGPLSFDFAALFAEPAVTLATTDGPSGPILGLDTAGNPASASDSTTGAATLLEHETASLDSTSENASPLGLGSVATETRSKLQTVPLVLASAWGLLALVGLGLFLRQHARLWRALAHKEAVTEGPLFRLLQRQTGDRVPGVRLWSSPRISSPLVLGRRSICVPSYALDELDAPSQAAMLAHEVAHLLRHDGAWLFFARTLQSLFPFQPLIRVAVRKLRQDAELLCDERALVTTGDGLALARCLATVAERFQGPALPAWSAAMAATPSELLVRVERVLGEPPVAPRRGRLWLTGALGLAALAVLACTGPRITTNGPTPNGAKVSQIDAGIVAAEDSDADIDLHIMVTNAGERFVEPDGDAAPSVRWTGPADGDFVRVGHTVEYAVNGFIFSGDELGRLALTDYFRQLAAADPNQKLAVSAQQGVVYEDIAPVLDVCLVSGLTHIDFVGSSSNGVSAKFNRERSGRVTNVSESGGLESLVETTRPKGVVGSRADHASIFAGADEREQMMRERELREIEKTIESLDFITQAELYVPKNASSASGTQRVSGVVHTEGGRQLTKDETLAVILFLKNALDSPADKIVLTDQAGRLIHGDLRVDTVPGQTSALAALGYVDEATPEAVLSEPIQTPAVTVVIAADGAFSIDGEVLVPGDSKDYAPLAKSMAAKSTKLRQALGIPSDGFAVIEEVLRISAPSEVSFSRVLQVMAQCGRRDVLMPNVQLDLRLPGGERRFFSTPLPGESDVPREEVEDDSEAAIAHAQPPRPMVTIRVEGLAWTMSSTTIDTADVRTVSPHAPYHEGFVKAVSAISAKTPGLQIVIEARPGTTVGNAAELLELLKAYGLLDKVVFVGAFE